MFKFDFSVYQESKQFFQLYDVIIKKEPINKDAFLNDLGITPSSYRRCRNYKQNIGNKIIDILNNHYGYKKCDDKFIKQIEDELSKIYYDMYYKNYESYQVQLDYLNDLLKERYYIFPIIELFKLFMIINSPKSASKIIKEYKEEYKDLLKYKSFFTDELIKVFDIIELSFEEEISNTILNKSYQNGLCYFVLSSRLTVLGRHIESLYYADKARIIFEKECNYVRLLYLNLTTMFNYNSLKDYNRCYELAHSQLLALKSLSLFSFEYKNTLKHMVVALLGLKKYNNVLALLSEMDVYTYTELACLYVAKYYVNKKMYKSEIDKAIEENLENDKLVEFLKSLDLYLSSNEKGCISKLKNYNLYGGLLDIINDCK